MSDNSNFEVNVEHIYDKLELLEKGRIYELQKAPGVPKCATLANRIRDDVDVIVKELNEREDTEATDEERFNLLAKLLGGLYAEFSALSKKQPDALTNAFKKDNGIRRFYTIFGLVTGSRGRTDKWKRKKFIQRCSNHYESI